MKKRLILTVVLCLFCVSCSTTAPFKSVTQGNVQEYLKQTPQATDHPNAGVLMLNSYAYVEYFKDGTSVTRHLERYKILNERGRRFATKTITYREGYSKATILFANTIKANGQVVSLAQSDVFEGTQYAGFDFYTDIKHKRFTLPAVEDGCIIEIAHEIENIKPVFNFDYSTVFLCRNLFPMEEDILEIVLPVNRELKFKSFQTDLTPHITVDGEKRRYVFTNLKQKEIVPEPRMPSLIDRETFPQIWIWTLSDWKSISSWYIRLFTGQMKVTPELKQFTLKLIEGKNTREEKISAIFNFVSQNIRYIAVLLGPHTHKPHEAAEVFQKRYGDCKDKTVLLLTMLKIAGIEGQPVLVPSHRQYFDEKMPSISAFNHVIAAVPNGEDYFWLDSTNEVASYVSPPFSSPSPVFVVMADGSYRFLQTPSPDPKKDYAQSVITLNIDMEGNADVTFDHTHFGKAAQQLRYLYKYLPPEQRRKAFEKRGIEVLDLDLGSFSDTDAPFFIRLKGKLKNIVQIVDADTMILSNIIRLDTYRDITASSERLYPILLHPSYPVGETFRYVFPDGFSIRKLPENYASDQPHVTRQETFAMKGSTFEVSVANTQKERKVTLAELSDFIKYALELQRHESNMKNLIFERKQ